MKKIFKAAFTGVLWQACTLQVLVNLSAYVFYWPLTAGWSWWQLYTPLLALATLAVGYGLSWFLTALWFSYLVASRAYNIKIDKANLWRARFDLNRLADQAGEEAHQLRLKIMRIEQRMEEREKKFSKIK